MLSARPDARVTEFAVAVHPDRHQVVVAPCGELDLHTVPQLRRELAELRTAGFAHVVVDLRGVTFMDSSGLHLLLDVHLDAQAAGWSFRLLRPTAEVAQLLSLTGTVGTFEFVGRS